MVETTDRCCCVVSIPGSGKTRVVTAKIAHLLAKTRFDHVTAVSFTAEAAKEIRERTAKLISEEDLKRLESGTFHSLVMKALKSLGNNSPMAGRRIARAGEARLYAERVCEDMGLSTDRVTVERMVRSLDGWRQLIELTPRSTHAIEKWDEYSESSIVGLATAAIQRYHFFMRDAGLIDFGEMIQAGARLHREDTQFKLFRGSHLIVDEFQDVDELQLGMMLTHARDFVVDGVGDDDQSIYKFRQGLGFEGMNKFIRETGALKISLAVNFRCSSEILAMADALIRQNTNRIDKQLIAFNGLSSINPAMLLWEDGMQEIEQVITMVDQRLKRSASKRSATSIAVLARKNAVLDEMALSMTARQIKFERVGDKSLWDKQPACFWLEGIKALNAPHLTEGLVMMLYWAGCEGVDIDLLRAEYVGTKKRFWGTTRTPSKLSPAGKDIVKRLAIAGEAMQAKLGSRDFNGVIEDFTDLMRGMIDGSRSPKFEQGSHKGLLTRACNMFKKLKGTLLERARMAEFMDRTGKGEDTAVKLVSMHSAKGLEFDTVFIVQCEDAAIPGAKATVEDEAEERRVLYVALTRARRELILTRAATYDVGPDPRKPTEIRTRESQMCRFIAEMRTCRPQEVDGCGQGLEHLERFSV
jgi:superfamily I DNA/RNA helicase